MTREEAFDVCGEAAIRLGFGPHRIEELTPRELEAIRMMAADQLDDLPFKGVYDLPFGGVYFLQPEPGVIDAGDFQTMD